MLSRGITETLTVTAICFPRKLLGHSECIPCNYPPKNGNEIVHLSGFALTAPSKIEQENGVIEPSLTAIGVRTFVCLYTSIYCACVCKCAASASVYVCLCREGERLREGSSNDDRQGCPVALFRFIFSADISRFRFVLVNVNGP